MSEDPYDKISKRYAEGLQKSMEDCLTGFNRMADNARKLIDEQAEERMKEDKELLELAAKAAGIEIIGFGEVFWVPEGEELQRPWNPLIDDGDALRLAVKLGLLADDGYTATFCNALDKDDPYAATRQAIVRAAAEIGRSMG